MKKCFLPGHVTVPKRMGSHSSAREAPVFAGVQDWEALSGGSAICSTVLQNIFGLSKSVLIVLYAVRCNSYDPPKICLVGIPVPRASAFWELWLLLGVFQWAERKSL